MNKTSSDAHKGEYHTIPVKTMEEKVSNWPESFQFYSTLKFSPFGFSSIEIPPFHRKNIAKNSTTTTVADFQSPSIDGRMDLKQAVVDHFPEIKRFGEVGVRLTTDNVLIASGAAGAIGSCIERFCEKERDDEIIMFEPIYKFHLAKMCSKQLTLKTVRTHYNPETNQFEADFEALKKALTPKTKVLLLTNPYNPTCKVFTPEEYKKISEIIKDYPDVVVVEDLAYFFCYDDAFDSVPYAVVNPHDFKRSVTIYSCGKLFNITGTKLGIVFGPEDLLGGIILAMLKEMQFTSAFDQIVIRDDIISAAEKDEHGKSYYDRTRKDLVQRAKYAKDELEKCGIKVVSYEGTYYIILDFENWRSRIDRKYYKSQDSGEETPELDTAVCRMLAAEAQIGALPLSYLHMGQNPPDRFIRIPINRNDDDLKMLLECLKTLFINK